MIDELLGIPWDKARAMLETAGVGYETEITRPTRVYFKIDKTKLHVVRVKTSGEKLSLVLAARMMATEPSETPLCV